MTLLAVGYLGVQYMLALGRLAFLPALGVVAVAEIALLGAIGTRSLLVFAALVLALQTAAAALRARHRAGAGRAARPRRRDRRRGLAHRRAGARASPRARPAAARHGAVVEIGSFRGRSTIVLARAAGAVVAIDPHAGGDRGPQEIAPEAERGRRGLRGVPREPGRGGRRRPRAARAAAVRRGALRRRGPALAALRRRRAPLRPGPGGPRRLGRPRRAGRDDARPRLVLVRRRHARAAGDRVLRGWRYAGRTGQPRRVPPRAGPAGATSRASSPQLPWFARNVAIKALILAGRRGWAERLGLDPAAPWPY